MSTGTVTFKDGATIIALNVTLVGNRATFTTNALTVGSHAITAVYNGDAKFNGSTSSALNQMVAKANSQIRIASSDKSSNYGQSVTLTATVSGGSGTPTGTVTFKDGATIIALNVTLVGNKATFTTNTLTVGSHAITAVYNSDANFSASTSSTLSQVVAKAGTSTRLTSSLNPSRSGNSVTFTVTVSTSVLGLGAPTGTVTFRDEGRTLGTVALNGSGKAIYTIASLSRGTHWISAVYSGNGNFSDSLGVLLQQVNR